MQPRNHPLLELWAFVRLAPTSRLLFLLIAFVLVALTEGIGIIMLVPLLESFSQTQEGEGSSQLLSFLPNLSITWLLALYVGLTIFRNIVKYVQSIYAAKLQYEIVDNLRLQCFSGLLGAEWRWLATRKRNDHVTLLVTNIARISSGIHQAMNLSASALTMVGLLIAALVLSWKITSVAVLGGIIFVWIFGTQRRRALALGHKLSQANRDTQSFVEQGLANTRLVKIMQKENFMQRGLSTVLGKLRTQQLGFLSHMGLNNALLQILGAIFLALLVYLSLVIWKQDYKVLLPLVVVFGRMIQTGSGVQRSYHNWLHALPALSEVQALLSDSAKYKEPTGYDATPLSFTKNITLKNVSFTYKSSNELEQQACLAKLSARFQANTVTLIMGPSGAGKSTLADILSGLLVPDSGSINVDGREIDSTTRYGWRKKVAYLEQHPFLFNDTIRFNLSWGHETVTEADIDTAIKAARADFVFRLDKGLDTLVGDNGVLLSGGERQRLALARALIGQPELLILDEPTSALDVDNENKILEVIMTLCRNMTIIIISHRPGFSQCADQTLILSHGQVRKVED